MARVRPFRAIRPTKELVSRVAALPYDVYSRAEAREAAQREPLSFLNIDRPETQFPEGYDMYAPEVYERAAQLLQKQLQEGIFRKDETPCCYIYELQMGERRQTGLVACASVDDYCSGVIKRHENTRKEKEQDRIRHVDTLSMQTGPIFLAYRQRERIQEIVRQGKQQEPEYDFVSEDGIRHRVWVLSEREQLTELEKEFEQVESIYIADGHHRAASAVRVAQKRRNDAVYFDGREEFNFFLAVLFPEQELKILPYYRLVRDLNGNTEEVFLNRLEQAWEVEKETAPVEPGGKFEFGMLLAGTWYRLRLKKELREELQRERQPVEVLDVSVLQKYLLEPVLGIRDPRTEPRIEFIGGIRGLAELERRVGTEQRVAFSLYPTSMEELFAVSDAGLLMPPKSTWFEPKLRSGMFLHEF